MRYLEAATSKRTRQAYQQDIRHFMRSGRGLPTTASKLIDYLTEYAPQLNSRTLARRLTAIKHWHLYQGFDDPTQYPAVRKLLTGIKNIHGVPVTKAPALELNALQKMSTLLKKTHYLIDCRNLALLQVGFFGALRRSELVNLKWEQLQWSSQGIEIMIPRSKTDQMGSGQSCIIPLGVKDLCAVTALKNWAKQANLQQGPVFRKITKNGKLANGAISAAQCNLILKNIAQRCHLPNAQAYSSHSLRRGFATLASQQGAPFQAIMRQGRWRHEATVLGYIQQGTQFKDNANHFIFKND
jgi:integrase